MSKPTTLGRTNP